MDYDTSGFPLGSKDPRVLYKNAKNFDAAMNGLSLSWLDRLGRMRKSWRGIENEWNTFLATTGFELPPLIYADGAPLVVERSTQLVQRNGSLYSIRLPANFPVELSGNWDDDQPLMVYRNDQPLRQDLADQDGGKLVGWTRTELSEQIKDVNSALDGSSINVWEYASLVSSKPNPEDPTTWDWAPAVQAAVDFCNAEFPAKELVVPTMLTLESPVNIDRPVDGVNQKDTFRIRGINGGGFKVKTDIPMFSTSLPQAFDETGARMPSSQNIRLENLTLTASDASLSAYVLDSNKLLRVFIQGCAISNLKLVKTTGYLQSIYLGPNNNIRGWNGIFLEANGGAYDVRAHGCQIEHGGNFWSTIDNTGNKSVSCCGVDNCLVEGLSGYGILYSHSRGFYVSNCYFEGNADPDIIADSFPEKANLGVLHIGNFHSVLSTNKSNPAFWAVRWGYTFGGTSLSNFCDWRLNFVRPDTQVTMNDAAQQAASNSDNKLVLNDVVLGIVRPSDNPSAYGDRYWRAGSIVLNRDHGSKGYAGWVCATSGTPGIWYPFGTTSDGASWNFTNQEGTSVMAKISVTEPNQGQTVLYLRYSNGNTIKLGQVLIGSADSGGVGYRMLRVEN